MSDLSSRFSTIDGVSGLVAGRFGGRAAALMPSGSLIHTLANPVGTGILGFAFRLNAEDAQDSLTITFGAPSGAANFNVVLDVTGAATVWSGTTVIAASATALFAPYTWVYCGIQAIAGTSGRVIVHIDGAMIITTRSFNTAPDGSNTIQSFGWQLTSAITCSSAYIDDVYFCDSSGAPPYNGFLGVCRLASAFPQAAGSHSDFTPSDPTEENWQAVGEHAMDGDTSYTSTTGSDSRDTFVTTTAIAPSETVLAVEPQIAARGTSGVVRTTLVAAGVEQSGQPITLAQSPDYRYLSDIFILNPATGLAWTSTDVASVQFGYSLTSASPSPATLITVPTTMPAQPWQGLAFGNGIFVAISSAVVATSPDGVVWTQHALPLTASWRDITYGNGIFVAVAWNVATAITSPDGSNWTTRSLPLATNWKSVRFGNNLFVAISYATNIAATSPNGITWTQRSLPANATWDYIGFGNGVFVVVSQSSLAATSADGIAWHSQTLPRNATWTGVAFGNGVYVAVAYNSMFAASSTDGVQWVSRTMVSNSNWISVTFNNGLFLAIAGGIATPSSVAATSPDGITWTAITMPSADRWIDLVAGNNLAVAIAYSPTP